MNKFKSKVKDKIFEELILELQQITRKSLERNFGSGGTHGTSKFNKAEKELSEHTLIFQYKGYQCIVQLK